MKSKKLSLDTLRIKSFVTDISATHRTNIKGGLIAETQENTMLSDCESGDGGSSWGTGSANNCNNTLVGCPNTLACGG